MSTQTRLIPADKPESIAIAVQALQAGQVVAFPTDTVYGLGALIHNPQSIEQLYQVKGRPVEKAIPILLADPDELSRVAVNVSPTVLRLARRFWPGPLTLVVPKHPALPEILSIYPTIGVRMPAHPDALGLLQATGPLAVTSANLSGAESPTTAQAVMEQLTGRVPLILDGGRTPGGLPSTVVDCTTPELAILRQGPLTIEQILAALQ
ncbi:MAG TPA: L-threonylcarbamoyladenylate synthase [Anaerolineales bacterium]|nr:L-threonylcarbamoyladenylate synthase [Anaerolineales bacterium]